jgi:SAM-dependent methyltransferase
MLARGHAARLITLLLVIAGFAAVPAAAQTAAAAKDYTPSVGQEGKDVIWVPTPQSLVERMLQMAGTKPTDYVVDLGSGDGRTVITAAKKFGAKALGVEYNPDMVELAKRNAQKEGVADRAQFTRADIFQTDFSQATVLTMYLLPSLNVKLRPTILNMKPGTRVVSHAFTMDDWQPDQVDSSDGRTAYMWIVPAKVGGTWRIEVAGGPRYEAAFAQQYQTVSGNVKGDGKTLQLTNGKLVGGNIVFAVEEGNATREFTGTVNGDRMEGAVKGGTGTKWTAVRVGEAH